MTPLSEFFGIDISLSVLVGALLLLWVLWDLYSGGVWLHREYRRSEEPSAYWVILFVWLSLALSFFFW